MADMQQPKRGNGDGGEDINLEAERFFASARDALTDDMVRRISATLTDGLDVLDRFNRSGVADALPTLSDMVTSGDLKRLADLARLVASAEDSLSDDIVTRLASTASGALDLLDRVNRSGIVQALPTIAQLVENGDLERLAGLARLMGAIEDSLSDDIVGRLSLVGTQLAALVDKLARNDGFLRLIDVLGREDVQCGMMDMAEAMCAARNEVSETQPSTGGIGGLFRLARDPATQDAMRFVGLVSKKMRTRSVPPPRGGPADPGDRTGGFPGRPMRRCASPAIGG